MPATFFESFYGQAGNAGGSFQREGLQAFAIGIESVHPLPEKIRLRPPAVQEIAADRAQPHQVCTGVGVQEEIGAPGHFVFAQVGYDELLPVQFVTAFDAGRNDRMTLRRIAANDEHQVGLLHVGDGTRVAAVAHGAEQTRGRRRLAVAGTVVDIVRADHGPRQFLHQIAFFIRALGRRDEREGVRSIVRL